MENKNYCLGCGYELQTEYPKKLGYIPKINEEQEMYCKRCYQMLYRNETPEIFLDDKDYWDLFDDIVKEKKVYILIIDLFNIEGTVIPQMINKLKNEKIILVLNKRDLLPKAVKDRKIIDNIRRHPLLRNLNIIDYIITSTKKKYNIDTLLTSINSNRKNLDVYLVGAANVGKSSITNALINAVLGDNKKYVTTSYFAGTTLGIIKIPMDDKTSIIDTPGIINNQDINIKLEKKTLEKIFPKTEIRPRTYQLQPEQTLFLSGFCQMDYVDGPEQGFTIYVSNEIDIHRTKLANAEEIRTKHLGIDLIVPPTKEELKFIKFKTEKIKIEKDCDIVINGLGWINVKNVIEDLELEITVPENIKLHIRKSII